MKTDNNSPRPEGKNINVELKADYGGCEYLLIWKEILLPVAKEFKPDVVLISAGFDACIDDPLGGMSIIPPCYGILTKLLMNICNNKVGIVLEGGYNLVTMPRAISYCMDALLDKSDDIVKEFYKITEPKIEYFMDLLNAYEAHVSKRYNKKILNKWRTHSRSIENYLDVCDEILKLIKNDHDRSENWVQRFLGHYYECGNIIKKVKNFHKPYWKCFQDKIIPNKSSNNNNNSDINNDIHNENNTNNNDNNNDDTIETKTNDE